MPVVINLGVGALDLTETPIINNTKKSIIKSNIKEVQINHVNNAYNLVISHRSWSRGVSEDLHLPLNNFSNKPTWTNTLSGAQICINEVTTWLNTVSGGGSGGATETTLQLVDSRLVSGGINAADYLLNISNLLKSTVFPNMSVSDLLVSSNGSFTADLLEALYNDFQNLLAINNNIYTSSLSIENSVNGVSTETTLNNVLNKLLENLKVGGGTINVLNGTLNFILNGQSVLNIDVTGTFVATFKIQIQKTGGTWMDLPNNQIYDYNTDSYLNNNLTSTGFYNLNVSGIQQVRIICTSYTSGTINAVFFGGLGQSTNTTDRLLNLSLSELTSIKNKINNIDISNTGNINAINQTVALTTINGHNTGAVQITGIFVGILQIQVSINGVDYLNITGNNSIVNSQNSLYLKNGNIISTGIYQFDLGGFKFFRVISTSWTSGTATIITNASTATSLVTAEGIEDELSSLDFHLISAAGTNPTIIKNSEGKVTGFNISNTTAAFKYVKLHNTNIVPVAGTTPVIKTIAIPPNNNIIMNFEGGINFNIGIAMTIVNGPANNDASVVALNNVIVEILYI